MVCDDALGIAGSTRCITERDCPPFVIRQLPGKAAFPGCQKIFVFDVADQFTVLDRGISHIDHERFIVELSQGVRHRRGVLGIRQ